MWPVCCPWQRRKCPDGPNVNWRKGQDNPETLVYLLMFGRLFVKVEVDGNLYILISFVKLLYVRSCFNCIDRRAGRGLFLPLVVFIRLFWSQKFKLKWISAEKSNLGDGALAICLCLHLFVIVCLVTWCRNVPAFLILVFICACIYLAAILACFWPAVRGVTALGKIRRHSGSGTLSEEGRHC